MKNKNKIKERVLSRVNKTKNCWLWMGCVNNFGYGLLRFEKKCYRVHRLSYLIYKGEIPQGMLVCHTCDNPPCVNPEHLFLGTHKDNARDRSFKGRNNFPLGERHGLSKLTKEKILEIRKLYGHGDINQKELAKMFSVDQTNISYIVNRKTWKHI